MEHIVEESVFKEAQVEGQQEDYAKLWGMGEELVLADKEAWAMLKTRMLPEDPEKHADLA